MLRISTLLLFIALGFAELAQAQVLQGRVTDAETGAALAGATLFVPSLQAGTATDQEGRYRLSLDQAGTYRVVFQFIGFQSETRTVTLGADPVTLDVALAHAAIEAPPVTITAKAQPSDMLSTPQAVAVLEGAELRQNRGVTAFDALEGTAGVHFLRTGTGISKPVVRGLTSQRVLVIQNGVRQEGQQWGDEHAPELDAFDIDRIEVVKGPSSLLYGSDALGGVIQATSRDLFGYRTPLTGELALQAMSNAPLGGAHVRLGGLARQWAYEGVVSGKRGGSFETPRQVIPNTGLEEVSGALRLGRQWKGGSLLAEYQHFGTRLGLFEPDEPAMPQGGRFTIAHPYQQIGHDRLRLQSLLSLGGHRLDLNTTWQQNNRKEFGAHGDEEAEGAAIRPGAAMTSEAVRQEEEAELFLRLTTLTADARFHHRPVGLLFGTIGLSGFLQRNETLGEETLVPGARTTDGAAYVFEELALPRLTLNGGVRFDARHLEVDDNEALAVTAQTRTYTALSTAVGLAWQPRTGLSLALNAGRAWRAPVLIELFGNGVHEGTIRFERGTPTLSPEQSLSLDATLRWLSRHAYIELTGFVNAIDDFIFPHATGMVDPASGFFIYQYEQAQARLWGGEFTADVHPHPLDWLHLHASGDVTLTRNRDTGDPLPFSPPARLNVEVRLEKEQWGSFQDVNLHFGPTLAMKQTRVAPLETPTDGYTLWDIGLSTVAQAGSVKINPVLSVHNLFDRVYLDHLSRFRPYSILSPGRNLQLQVQFTFGP